MVNILQSKSYKSRQRSGQGLVEYALILALVAIVVVGGAGLLGLATQRVYGIVAAGLGAKHDSTASSGSLTITTALCIAKQSQNLTGLWVIGDTSDVISNLTGSTENAVGTGIGGATSPVEAMGTSGGLTGYKFHPLLATAADVSVCPKAVVIQSTSGLIAVAPVMAEVRP